jgi:hypothetical protein
MQSKGTILSVVIYSRESENQPVGAASAALLRDVSGCTGCD